MPEENKMPDGVYKEKDRNSYTASIYINNKKIRRRFKTLEEAISARRYAEIYKDAFEQQARKGMLNWEENAKRMLLNPEGGKRMEPIKLNRIGVGEGRSSKSLEELYEEALIECANDIMNPNKDVSKKRQIIITLSIEASVDGFDMEYSVKKKLQPDMGEKVVIDKDTMKELKFQKGIPGQLNVADVESIKHIKHYEVDENGEIIEE